MAKRGRSIRQIAAELGRSPTTIARVLHEPVDKPPTRRRRSSMADGYRAQIEEGIAAGLSNVRLLERARADQEQPFRGGRTIFDDLVRQIRREVAQQQAARDVPIRFEGLPAEYLQVDWGEVRRFPFTQQEPATRYFLACRLKYSRWSWVRFTDDMRQETLFRGLVDCFAALGWVPWVLVFDNMKTVTSGRDSTGQPVWTPSLLQLAHEFGFHPQACDPGAGNQKGSVESLVKWVKGNFLLGRRFGDDPELTNEIVAWCDSVNARPSDATGVTPESRLAAETIQGGRLPSTAHDFGLLASGQVSRESLVAVAGNRYSVPVCHVGAPVTARIHRDRIRIWHDTDCLADHPRATDGARQRIIDPAHFAALFPAKPRVQTMLYREVLVGLGGVAPAFLSELSHRRRNRLRHEMLTVYALYLEHGGSALLAAMAQAETAGVYQADALAGLLAMPAPAPVPAPSLRLVGLPPQHTIDRALSVYEAWVDIDDALPEVG